MEKERRPAPPVADIRPMLLTERKSRPRGEEWSWELKMDGYRMLASTGQNAQLRTKSGADATAWFPELIASLATLPAGNIVDGEVCVLDDIGRSDFNRVHARALRRRYYVGADLVTFCLFDQIAGNGADMRAEAIETRRRSLKRLLSRKPDHMLLVTSVDDPDWLYSHVLALELEGIVGKRSGSVYRSGERSPDWVKVKRPGAVPAKRFER